MRILVYYSNLRWLLLSLVVVILDFFSKNWVMSNCVFDEPIRVLSFINLYYVCNFGIAFSLFSDFCIARSSVLLCIIMLIIVVLVIILFCINYDTPYIKGSYAMVIGGALGNIFDRIHHGFVVDFIDVHIFNYHFPTFNLADLSIFFGTLIIFLFVRGKYDKCIIFKL